MKNYLFIFLPILTLIFVFNAEVSLGKTNKSKSKNDFQVISSTHFDFSEATITGEMKAPDGFYLQGRQSQSLSQMVKLRPNFKNQLRNSKSAVKALAH